MKKRYVTYSQYGKIKKAVLDESLYNQLSKDNSITEVVEYDSELLMEKRFAEKLGVTDTRKTLLG